MNSFEEDILNDSTSQTEDAIEKRRESFRQTNASMALSGFVADEEQLALQEKIIQGRLTWKQASALVFAKYSQPE